MRVDFDLTSAQPAESNSIQFSNEVARNVYFGISETSKKIGCHDFPGLKLVSAGQGVDYGDHVMSGVRYLINGSNLISENAAGVRTTLDSSLSISERAIFADDGTNLYFVANSTIYKYNGATLSTVSQTVVTNPSSIAYINQQFIISGDNGAFSVSNVGDGDAYTSISTGSEDTKPDDVLRLYVYNQLLYIAGTDSLVPYSNTGTGSPPVQRQDTALVNIGLAGKHAIANTKAYMYCLGSDLEIYRIVGARAQPIHTIGVAKILEGLGVTSDCIVSAFVLTGMNMVLFKFPVSKAAILYNESNNTWTELSAGTDKNARDAWYGSAVTKAYGKNLVVDYRNGNTYELDFSTYTDNGDARLRIVSTRNYTCKDIRVRGRKITASQLGLECQTGVGIAFGQGSDPKLMCEFSNDGGQSWGGESHVDLGVMGDHQKLVRFDRFTTGYEVKSRVVISDPVPFSCYGGYMELIDGGY